MAHKPRGVPERFWPKVAKTDGCWLWTGAMVAGGYGRFNLDGRSAPAHRVAYMLLVGQIPDGFHLDHLCRNHSCVNPAHLEPVTPRENTMRGVHPKVLSHHAGLCSRGHSFAEVGVRVYRDGRKACRLCIREGFRKWIAARRARKKEVA